MRLRIRRVGGYRGAKFSLGLRRLIGREKDAPERKVNIGILLVKLLRGPIMLDRERRFPGSLVSPAQ